MTSYDRRNLHKNGGGIGINKIGSLVYRSEEFVRKVFYKIFRESVIKSSFGSCGKNVHIAEKSDIKGIGNISIGDDVAIGSHALLWTTRANIIIKEKVIIGPRLSIITGDHKMNAVGKYMADVTDEELKQLEKLQMVSFERFLGKKYRLYLPNTGKADERQLKFYIKTVS